MVLFLIVCNDRVRFR